MNKTKILVVDDEEDIVDLLTFTLEGEDFDVLSACDGIAAIEKIKQEKPSLIILDIMMPRMDGIACIKYIRSKEEYQNLPIIIASAKSTEEDIVKGLDLGADDYITKPFSLKVVSAKVKALLRRNRDTDQSQTSNILSLGPLEMNRTMFTTILDGTSIELTSTEFELLSLMVQQPDRVFTRNQLINESKGSDYSATERSIDVQVVALRRKLGNWGKQRIKTVWGIGYKIESQI